MIRTLIRALSDVRADIREWFAGVMLRHAEGRGDRAAVRYWSGVINGDFER